MEDPQPDVAVPVSASAASAAPRRRGRRYWIVSTLQLLLILVLVFSCLLLLIQRKMIYFPRRYEPSYARGLTPGTAELHFQTAQGTQAAFYIPPTEGDAAAPPPQLWVVFCGNAMGALDWLDFVEGAPRERSGFLLIDYPGYGISAGSPSRGSIQEASDGAYSALAEHLRVPPAALDERLNVLGLSIGCATGLDFAVHHPVHRVVLLAPFTSLLDMARRTVPPPFHYLAMDRYDNRARLRELMARPDPPSFVVIQGMEDQIIPVQHGRELHGLVRKRSTLHLLPGWGHEVLDGAAPIVYDEIRATAG